MPTLNSFISPTIYSTELTTNPLYAGMLSGSTFVPPTFNGASGSASNDPGGLFGWLIYARTQLASPARGATTNSYIEYKNYNSLINDLNLLSGTTYCLISKNTEGGTFGFFSYSGPEITPKTNGYDFLHALNYLSYGGVLVLAGNCTGLISYTNDTNNDLDVLIGQTANATTARFVENNDYIIGIFPASNNGAGYTASSFDTLFNNPQCVVFTEGATVSDRIFNVGAQSLQGVSTDSLQPNTYIQYTISSVSDAAGAFVRSKNAQNLPLTVAGLNYSNTLNTKIINAIDWTDNTAKDIYKKNRVNFYSKAESLSIGAPSYFLGSDLIGATAAGGSTYTTGERFGPAYIKNLIQKNVEEILLKYLFSINNASTRSAATTEITLFVQTLNQYLDPGYTQIICDGTNNTDNGTTLSATVIVKPILSTTAYTVEVTLVA